MDDSQSYYFMQLVEDLSSINTLDSSFYFNIILTNLLLNDVILHVYLKSSL
jgi:hypothetical protein